MRHSDRPGNSGTRPVDALVDLCVNTAQPLLKPNVVLEWQVDESLNIIHSDQDKIRQILLNLLSNAAKFTHTGKILLAAKKDGENLRVSVSDTGIGISAEALPRIFKEFQQADNTTTRQYGGTGLGFSISRNLARLLGGDITVESELGKGSTFTLVIPIQYGQRPASRMDIVPAPAKESFSPPHSDSARKRILVIDEDPDAVYLLQENLNPQEFEILGAQDGQNGIRLAHEGGPQAILLDIVMPGMDGWQVLHDLNTAPATKNIPVVFLTIVDKKALGFQLGAALFMTLFRSLIRATATSDIFCRGNEVEALTPSERLQHVVSFTNNYIAETHTEANMFATVFIGIFDIQDGTLTYVNCGNEPPLIVGKGSEVTTLGPTGPVVGLFADAQFFVKEISIKKNDLLLAFTDGIPDSKDSEDEFFGRQRLVATLGDGNITPSALIVDIETQLHHFIGATGQFDDITLLAVKREA